MFTRKRLNKILRRFGYELKKVDRFPKILEREYESSEPFRFVQIGANDGVRFDDLFGFVVARECQGIVIEPLRFFYQKLERAYAAFPEITPINVAIHATQKSAVIHYVDPDKADSVPDWAAGIGSFDPDHHKQSGIPFACIISEDVACVHLMDLLAEREFLDINFMQIDVEGYDGEVIRMIDFSLIKPNIIKYEHASLPLPEQKQISNLLKSHGYELYVQDFDTMAVNTRTKLI